MQSSWLFTNLKTLTDCVLAAFVAGAVIAVLKMLYMRNLRISLFKAQVFLRELFSGKFSSYRNGWVQEQNLMHFSVAGRGWHGCAATDVFKAGVTGSWFYECPDGYFSRTGSLSATVSGR
jgi:hypothetical protein